MGPEASQFCRVVNKAMKLAIVHDYLNQLGGAERVVCVLHQAFPQATLFTSFYVSERTFPYFRKVQVQTSFMQHLPGIENWFRAYLCLYPFAFSSFDLSGYDVVLSSSSGWAHRVSVPGSAVHVCYCYTPARWLWDLERYLAKESFGFLVRSSAKLATAYLREQDLKASSRPDYYVAISHVVAARIRRYYGRRATVIYPPVNVTAFPFSTLPGDYYLLVSRLVGYKRVDLVIDAFRGLPYHLRIVGEGPCRSMLQSKSPSNVEFLGALSDEALVDQYVGSRALVFPGEEDFGIAPLEANACGRPVIAFAGGGALETVLEGKTGMFFTRPHAGDLGDAIERSRMCKFDPYALREHAQRFGPEVFRKQMSDFLERCCVEQKRKG